MDDTVTVAAEQQQGSGPPQALAGLARVRIKGRGPGAMGPAAFLADRREQLGAMEWEHFDVRPLGVTIGAEVSGVGLADDLPAEVVAQLRSALVAFKVLVFRDQPLDAESQSRFASRFGELERHPFLGGTEDNPELVRLAKDATVGGYENIWHSDVTWREVPALGAVLRAVELPDRGGDTLWADMEAAYAGLDDDLRDRIDGLVAVNDFKLSFGMALSGDDLVAAEAQYPAVEHPVVRTHPESGRRALYVNRIFTSHIVGMSEAESEQLLATLFAQSDIPEYQFRLRWEPDTVAMWDNRCTQHYAASDYWPQARVMERAAIVGDRPV